MASILHSSVPLGEDHQGGKMKIRYEALRLLLAGVALILTVLLLNPSDSVETEVHRMPAHLKAHTAAPKSSPKKHSIIAANPTHSRLPE